MRVLAGGGTSGSEWDDAVLRMAEPHVLQSSAWGAIKSRWGWAATRLAWGEPGNERAVAQVLTRRLARSTLVGGYVPKGPLLRDPAAVDVWAEVLGDLADWSAEHGLTWLKIDPDVPAESGEVATVWSEAGWLESDSQVQFPNTMFSDLSVGQDALLAGMKSKTRYNVKLAGRRGVGIRRGGVDDFARFYELYAQTAARTGFGIRTAAYYEDVWSTFLRDGRAAVILAEREGQVLAGVIPVRFGRTVWYLYGASGETGRQHMPAYLAQWDSLCWALEQGCDRYDWWGGPTSVVESDPMWGVYRFKSGFGAVLARGLGAWDLPVQRLRYEAFSRLERLRRRAIAATQ